jgi:hypothetical protein
MGGSFTPSHRRLASFLLSTLFYSTLILDCCTSTQMCVYEFSVNTPMACEDEMEDVSLKRLDELGVFGFSPPGSSGSKSSTTSGSTASAGGGGGQCTAGADGSESCAATT